MRLLDRISLPSIAKSNPISFWVAIVLHMAIIVGLVFTGFQSWEIPQKELKNSISKSTPKIVAVNPEVYKKATQRILDIQKKKELKKFSKRTSVCPKRRRTPRSRSSPGKTG